MNTPLAPTIVAWQFEGKPECGKPGLVWNAGIRCGSCHLVAECTPARKALSTNFGSWDDISPGPDGLRWLCRACAWAYRHTAARYAPIEVTAARYAELSWQQLGDRLLRGAIPTGTAYSVPLGGKRWVLPRAKWGRVCTDYGVVPWGLALTSALQSVREMRTAGCKEGQLRAKAPPIGVGRTVEDQLLVSRNWDATHAYRNSPTLWMLLVKASRSN